MSHPQPQRITRAYARGLVAAVAIFAVALLVFTWGLTALALQRDPVVTEVPKFTAPAAVGVGLVILVWFLWRELISMIQGGRPHWVLLIVVPGLTYILWSLVGTLAGLGLDETWVSPFSALLAVSWLISILIFWWILIRKLYSSKGRPQWPWEKKDLDEGPDWFKDGMP